MWSNLFVLASALVSSWWRLLVFRVTRSCPLLLMFQLHEVFEVCCFASKWLPINNLLSKEWTISKQKKKNGKFLRYRRPEKCYNNEMKVRGPRCCHCCCPEHIDHHRLRQTIAEQVSSARRCWSLIAPDWFRGSAGLCIFFCTLDNRADLFKRPAKKKKIFALFSAPSPPSLRKPRGEASVGCGVSLSLCVCLCLCIHV